MDILLAPMNAGLLGFLVFSLVSGGKFLSAVFFAGALGIPTEALRTWFEIAGPIERLREFVPKSDSGEGLEITAKRANGEVEYYTFRS